MLALEVVKYFGVVLIATPPQKSSGTPATLYSVPTTSNKYHHEHTNP